MIKIGAWESSSTYKLFRAFSAWHFLVIRFLGRWPRLLHFAPLALAIVNDYRRDGFVRIIASGSLPPSVTNPLGCALRAATPAQTSRHIAAVQSANRTV